jgi:hypothetical protein
VLVLGGGVARAEPNWPDYVAGRLRQDPVFVTDQDSQGLDPVATAARIKRTVAALGVPVYVAVTLSLDLDDRDSDSLIPLLHDRLHKDGVYIVTTPGGSGGAVEYGGSLPVRDAWSAAEFELSAAQIRDGDFHRTAPQMIQRFVDIVRSGQVAQRLKAAEQASDDAVKADRAKRRHGDGGGSAVDIEPLAGAAVTGLPLLALLIRRRRRKRR